MTRHESFLIQHVVIMTPMLPCPSMVFYPIRRCMCPILHTVRSSQDHMPLDTIREIKNKRTYMSMTQTKLVIYFDCECLNCCNYVKQAIQHPIVGQNWVIFPNGSCGLHSCNLGDACHHINISKVNDMSQTTAKRGTPNLEASCDANE